MPTEVWSFAVQHACEMLRCRKLRLAGDEKIPRCWPFGTYVALRVPGKTNSFGAFEMKGQLGHDPSHVGDEEVTSLEEAGWKRIVLEDGAPAWLHEGD
eukprot:4683580-Amphidinium_carterae.1